MFATPKVTEVGHHVVPPWVWAVDRDTFCDEAVHIDGSRGPVMPGSAPKPPERDEARR